MVVGEAGAVGDVEAEGGVAGEEDLGAIEGIEAEGEVVGAEAGEGEVVVKVVAGLDVDVPGGESVGGVDGDVGGAEVDGENGTGGAGHGGEGEPVGFGFGVDEGEGGVFGGEAEVRNIGEVSAGGKDVDGFTRTDAKEVPLVSRGAERGRGVGIEDGECADAEGGKVAAGDVAMNVGTVVFPVPDEGVVGEPDAEVHVAIGIG